MNDLTEFIKTYMKTIDRDTSIVINISNINNSLNISKNIFDQKMKLFDQKGYNKTEINYTNYSLMNKTLKIMGNQEQCFAFTPIDTFIKNIGFNRIIASCERKQIIQNELFPCQRNYKNIQKNHETAYNINNLFNVIFINYDNFYTIKIHLDKQNIYEDMLYDAITNTLKILI